MSSRDLIRTRTAEGRSRAKAQGKHMGHPPSLTPAQQKEAIRCRAQGATLQELADSYDRSISIMRASRAQPHDTRGSIWTEVTPRDPTTDVLEYANGI
jgi:DNA invertase Pin-like site-specific DNA recombinase